MKRRLRPAVFAFIIAMVCAFFWPMNAAHADVVSLTELSSGTTGIDAASYTLPTVTVPSDARLLLYVTSGRTDGTAAKAVGVSGLGGSWQEVASVPVSNGNLFSSVFTARVTAGVDGVVVTFPTTQLHLSWRLVMTSSADDAVVQATTAASSTKTPTASLPTAPTPGNATVGFVAALSTSQTMTTGSGFVAVGPQYTNTVPTVRGAAEWRTDGQGSVAFTASGTAQKAIIALEVGTVPPPPPPPDKDATVAVIGDSLTYQDGLGEKAIAQALVDDGYGASNVYVYGIGGKKITAKDSRGKTTVQNIAEARAKLATVDIWVIALGTNNVGDSTTTFSANVNAVLDAIGPDDRVVWVNLAFYRITNSNAAKFNPLLQAAVSARPHASYADWNSFIHDGRDETGLWVYPVDATHMTQAGYAARNAFVLTQVDAVYASLQPVEG